MLLCFCFFFFSSRRRHTRWNCDWSSDVCSSDLGLFLTRSWWAGIRFYPQLPPPGERGTPGIVVRNCEIFDIGGDLRHNPGGVQDRKSTRLNSSHSSISYAVFCLKKKKKQTKNKY